jgi:hypothetical protein
MRTSESTWGGVGVGVGGGSGATRGSGSTVPAGFGDSGRSLGDLKLISRHRQWASMPSMTTTAAAAATPPIVAGVGGGARRSRFALQQNASHPMPEIYRPKTVAATGRCSPTTPSSSPFSGGSGGGGAGEEDSTPFLTLLAPSAAAAAALTPRSHEKLVKAQSHARSRAVARKLPQLRHAHKRGEQRRNKARARKTRAATQVQKIFRAHYVWVNRHRIVELRARAAAAVELQRYFRGLLVRRGAEREGKRLTAALWAQAQYVRCW